MFAYDLPLSPPANRWEDCDKIQFIEEKVQEICKNIAEKGEKTLYPAIFDLLFLHIEDNLQTYLPEVDYGIFE